MTNFDLAADYMKRAESRLKALQLLFSEGNFPDTVRGAKSWWS